MKLVVMKSAVLLIRSHPPSSFSLSLSLSLSPAHFLTRLLTITDTHTHTHTHTHTFYSLYYSLAHRQVILWTWVWCDDRGGTETSLPGCQTLLSRWTSSQEQNRWVPTEGGCCVSNGEYCKYSMKHIYWVYIQPNFNYPNPFPRNLSVRISKTFG